MALYRNAVYALLTYFALPEHTRAAPADRIVGGIDDRARVTLAGNRHPLARAEFERGRVNPEEPMERMILVLSPDPAQQSELDALVAAQQDSASPLYHRWITPEEYGRRFGVSDHDLAEVAAWLTDH